MKMRMKIETEPFLFFVKKMSECADRREMRNEVEENAM